MRGTHAARLDQVRNGGPGGTHGPTGCHVPNNMGRRSAGRRHRSTGYDRLHHVRRLLQTRPSVWRQQQPRHHERHPGLPQLVHSTKHPPPHPARRPTRVAPYWATGAGLLPARRRSHRSTQHHQPSAYNATTDTGAAHTPQSYKTPNSHAKTNTGPPNKGTAQQPTKGPNPPTPLQLSNNSKSLSPYVTSETNTNYPEGGTTRGARQRHGDYRQAPSIGRKPSQG